MTVIEMNNEFDIHYNSIAGMSAPGIDLYEKSVYLTKAQLEIVKNHYDPDSNRKQKGFEATEKRRVDLKELISSFKSSTSFTNDSGMHSTSRFFNIPNDVYLITNESAKLTSTDCFNNNILEVKPTTQDEFDTQIKNPFKTPNEKIAWRLDFAKIAGNKVVEIVSPYNITGTLEYRMRYLKYPKPIILGNLTSLFPGDNLSIEGLTALTPCELDAGLHSEILDRAIEFALRDYKPQGLESKIQMDTRNE